MAIRSRVVGRDLQRRTLSRREAGADDEGERGQEAPNEGRGVKELTRAEDDIIDQANVIQNCCRVKTKLALRRAAAVLTAR
jgi:hypothetical protein